MTDVTDALRNVLGNTYVLYAKTHSYHWNVRGPNFQSLHALFMDQYTAMWQSLDEIAERVRSLGFDAPTSSKAIIAHATIPEDGDTVPKANAMLEQLIADHTAWLEAANKAWGVASHAGDVATEDLLTPLISSHEKDVWMLKSSLEQ